MREICFFAGLVVGWVGGLLSHWLFLEYVEQKRTPSNGVTLSPVSHATTVSGNLISEIRQAVSPECGQEIKYTSEAYVKCRLGAPKLYGCRHERQGLCGTPAPCQFKAKS